MSVQLSTSTSQPGAFNLTSTESEHSAQSKYVRVKFATFSPSGKALEEQSMIIMGINRKVFPLIEQERQPFKHIFSLILIGTSPSRLYILEAITQIFFNMKFILSYEEVTASQNFRDDLSTSMEFAETQLQFIRAGCDIHSEFLACYLHQEPTVSPSKTKKSSANPDFVPIIFLTFRGHDGPPEMQPRIVMKINTRIFPGIEKETEPFRHIFSYTFASHSSKHIPLLQYISQIFFCMKFAISHHKIETSQHFVEDLNTGIAFVKSQLNFINAGGTRGDEIFGCTAGKGSKI